MNDKLELEKAKEDIAFIIITAIFMIIVATFMALAIKEIHYNKKFILKLENRIVEIEKYKIDCDRTKKYHLKNNIKE
jgi:hypothetical protein